jgi:hypothetical protein
MYGTGAEAGAAVVSVDEEEVSVELEEVSVEVVSDEGALVVSVVEALLAVVSVPVRPTTESDWPNAPEAISPNAKRTARPIPIRRDRFRSVLRAFSVPCRALSLITSPLVSDRPEPHPTRRDRAAPGGRVKLG